MVSEIISISKTTPEVKRGNSISKIKNIYSSLKYESGVHRVQRVPDTETQGRVHTSAATVAVAWWSECKYNLTHCQDCPIPTGIVVSQQDEESQIRNKEKGLKILGQEFTNWKDKKR